MPKGLFRRVLMAPDTVARHTAIAELLSTDARTLLDVGGNRGELELFTPGLDVTSINVAGEEADLTYDGDILPFADGSFDAVVSLDVLEHIPSVGRERHVRELLRVARRQVLLCCPLGSSAHVAAERSVAEEYEQLTDTRHRFLDEHLELGLPTKSELEGIARATGSDHEFFFQGDFRRVNELFLNGVRLKARPSPGKAFSYFASRGRAGRKESLRRDPDEYSNRIFLRIPSQGSEMPS